MAYQITLPDGSIGLIDDSVPRNRAMEAAQVAYPDAFPGIGEQLLSAPGEVLKGLGRGFVDPVTGLASTAYTGLRAAGFEMAPFAETSVGRGLADIQESLAPKYGTISEFAGAVGGLGSFLVPGTLMAKGLGRAATLGGMATGLGAEEARSRVEQARTEGIEVTPGQEFAAQLGGTAIGLTELAPIERLTGPIQAVLRGVKKSDADMIAPGLFNSAKRIVETAGIEGLQEGMANVAQDLLAKGIYNPNLDIGESALGDAAMGASVGAFAQGVIELATKGRRKTLYENLKAEEDAKTRVAEAEKARLAQEEERKKTLANFGVEGQPLLLAAPQAQVTPSREEKSALDKYGVEDKALFEPFGSFNRDELDPAVVKELDKRRKEAGRPKTETFTIQDIADTGVYRAELDRLLAQRSGYTGEVKFKPTEVIGLAQQKNIDTSTQGFSDFVSRVTGIKPMPDFTGINALRGLNDVELFAVREALNKLPNYEQPKILPTGKSAKIFDEKQANKTLTSITKTLSDKLGAEGLGETTVLQEIGDFSGLEDVNDQRSLLEKYISEGKLERTATPAYGVFDAKGNQVTVVRGRDGQLTQAERAEAQRKAQQIGGTVKGVTINNIKLASPVNRLIGGADIREGVYEDDKIQGYDITTETGEVIGRAPTLQQAEAAANRTRAVREQRQQQLVAAKQKIQESIAAREQELADMESLGQKNSEQYSKLQGSIASQKRNLTKVEQNIQEFGKGVSIAARHGKQKRSGFTLFQNNKPVGTYNSRQEALDASVVALPTDKLEGILDAFPTLDTNALPGKDRADIKRIQQVAAQELASRKGQVPSGVGVTVEGDITAAEERLALQGIFSPRIKERVNELDKKLRAALDALGLKEVRLNIVGAIKGELGVADGAYAARLIKIALDAENPMRVLRHEAIHALKELGAFTPDQWRVLENKAKSEWIKKYNIVERYQGLDPESMIEEAISDAFSDFSQTKPPAGLIRNIFEKIKNFFARLDNVFKGAGFQTSDDVFTQVELGQLLPGMGERAAEVQSLSARPVRSETERDVRLDIYEPLSVHGTVNVAGEKYSLLQHGSRNDFEKIDKTKLGGFAFGYGAYTSVTPREGLLTTQDFTETARLYAGQNNGFVYVSDIPITKSNTLNLDLPLEEQPVITKKLVNAGIVEPTEAGSYYKYRMTAQYGGDEIYSPYQLPDAIASSIVNEALVSGFPVTGLRGQGPGSIKFAHGDPLSAKEKASNILRDAGINALWIDNASISTKNKEPYVVILDPENFNNNIIGKYKIDTDNRGRVNIKTIVGQNIKEPSVLNKIKNLLTSFNKERPKSDVNYKDLPEIDGARQERYSLRPRKLKSGEIVGSPPNARTEPQRTVLVRQMTDLLRSPFTMLDVSKNWYEDSGAAIRAMTRNDPELTERVVRLMALYSQANGVGANTTATIKSIYQLATGQSTAFAGRFPNTTAERIPAILAAPTMDDSLPGVDDKLMNFYRNLHDATFQTETFDDASTIDRWMMRLFGYPHTEDQDVGGASGLSNTQYLYAKDLIRRISDAHFRRSGERLLPRQIQAALWTYVKNKTDYDSLSPEKQATFEPTIVDFSDYITRATANITWETRPSTSVNLIPGIHKAPRNQQEAFNRAVRGIFVDENGNDLIFQLLGGEQLYSSQFSMGAYENKIAPNIITKLVLRKDDNDYLTDSANKYASIVGYVTKQDAVPWYRADPTAAGRLASVGFRVTPSVENVDAGFEQRLFDHLNSEMPGVGFTRVDNSFDFVNFRGEDGKPFFMADNKYKSGLQKALESFPEDVKFNVEPFRAESAYISNNWKEKTNGEGYLSAFSPGELANIQNTIDGWRSSYERIAGEFGREFGWSKFSLRATEPSGRPSDGSGIVLGESQPGAKSFTGTHYGKSRVDVLSGSFYGSGIRGAEASRLAQSRDPRIKRRVYFYVPLETGAMPRPEAGLGNFVYQQTLNNILPPGEIMSRLYNEAEQDANAFESAVVDAGYDGYAVPSMGMMVVLNHNVPVEYLGTRDTIRNLTPAQKFSLRTTDTPEFKQWFGSSKIVDSQGRPKVMYHGTARDITEFKPKQAGAIFVTDDPRFAEDFSYMSETWMIDHATQFLPEQDIKKAIAAGVAKMAKGRPKQEQIRMLTEILKFPVESVIRDPDASDIRDEIVKRLPSRPNIVPVYIRAENPFDFENPSHLEAIRSMPGVPVHYQRIRKGDWSSIEDEDVQDAIRAAGFDGFYVKEGDRKNLAVYQPDQLKSVTGNIGTYGQREPTLDEAKQFGLTIEEAKAAQKRGDIRYSLRQQAAQTLGQGYLNTVERTTTPRVEQGLGDRISEAINGTPFAKFRQMFINKYERIEYYSRELAKRFGDAVLLADTSAIAAALMSDRAAGVAAESFKSGIPVYNKGYTYVDNMNGKVKGLMDILMPLAQKQDPFVYQMFQDYAGRRRGVRLDAQGKVTPFTSQELADIPKIEKAFPEFKQVFEDYQRYNEGLVRYMRDTGVIDAKAAQEWMKYGDYIPFYRQLEGERTVGPSIFSAISGVKAPKKLKGGEAPLGEFLETVIRNSRAAIEAGMRNVAATRVVNNFQRLNSPSGVGRLVEKVTEKERDLPDVVTVRENGKDAFYKVADPLLVQSMQALNIPHIPGLDILAKPAEFLREMVTRDPAFIGASVLRESLSAWITTGQKLTPVVDGVKQFGKILANASPEVERLRKAGIGSGYEFKGDVQATSGEFSKQLKQRAGEMTAAQRAAKPISWMWDSLDKASTAADLSTRAEVFKRVMEETGNEAEAVYQAMEVINFSRKGSSPIIQIFAAIIPFLNARIQGLDLLYRAGFGRLASATKVSQQKAFMIRSLALLGSTAMYYAMVQDEEEWKNADQEVRDNYWIIGGMKFPIPFELGVMFKVIPERIMAYTMGDDTGKEVRESIVRQITGTLAFNPIPQAVLPLIEASSNYSFFLGRDIVGMGKRDLAPEFQISEGTSKIAIELGQTLGISPMKIDYVLRGYTGAMGTYAITAMDSIIRSEDDATKATWRLDQIPVLKRFMISDLGAGTVNDYYDLKDKVDEVVRTSNQLERTGDIKALTEYLKDNGQVLNVKDYVRDLDKDMKALRESRLAINISRMEPDQKREALDALRKAEIALTERIGTLRKSMGI